MTKFLNELKRRLFETHYRILEVERCKSGVKLYHVQQLGLLGWDDIWYYSTVEEARKAVEREKNIFVIDAKVIEEF